MLRAGLQTELVSCLANRKRKLSELFACTVGFSTELDPKYRSQETQFLDANDLEKNRYFSIATLPPRPDTRDILVQDQSLQTDIELLTKQPEKGEESRTSRHGVNVVGDENTPISNNILPHGSKEDGLDAIATPVGDDLKPNGQKDVARGQDAVLADHGSIDGADNMNVEILPPSIPEKARISELGSPSRSLGIDIGSTGAVKNSLSKVKPGLSIPGADKAVEDTVMADAHSSPASSHGAASSNQEAAVGSPTTSPSEGIDSSAVDRLDAELAATSAKGLSDSRGAHPEPVASSTQDVSSDPPARSASAVQAEAEGQKATSESSAAAMPLTNPRRVLASQTAMPSPPERMTTRVSSGAIRHKSVSEILGETPKATSPSNEKGPSERTSADSSRAGSVAVSVATGSGRPTPDNTIQLRQADRRDKERSRLSTVVFAKQQPVDRMDSTELLLKVAGENPFLTSQERDYLWTLFESRAHTPPRALPLGTLLQTAHKTLTTSDHLIDYQEQMNCRTLKRIYQLQNANRWPLRQMERAAEPPRATSHWDFLLDHMKWLRTDFREERKWKLAAAKGMAEWCAEWWASDAKGRKALQVQVRAPRILPQPSDDTDVSMEDQAADIESSHPTPELVEEDDSVSDGFIEDPRELRFANAPAAIFSLGPGDFSFPISKTPTADKLLNELPLYQPARVEPDLALSDLAERMDARWKKDILPVSKFATAKIRFITKKVNRKRSRYDYESDDDDGRDSVPLASEQKDVGLFMPENKHIRDRIHPGHQFRPPTEHPMPTQAFFEARTSSHWTHTEDDELRKLVKDYSYNWSLISSCLTPKSMYHSGYERRTPWECFERWIGLEGLPADMSKTPYFRAYHSRIEAAGRNVLAQQQAAQQAAAANGQPSIPPRKRTTQPMRVERRRATKHLAMIDAMRKLAKKRETALQKAQHAAGLAAMRRGNEAKQPSKPPISTPAEFSRLKHERELKAAEKAELYRQQVLAHQKAAMQHRTAQAAPPNPVPNGATRASNGIPVAASPNGGPAHLAGAPTGPNGQVLPQNQPRTHPALQGLPTGASPSGPLPTSMINMKGLPAGQLPPNLVARGLPANGMPANTPESLRILYEANRVQAEQQRFLAQRQQQAQIAQQQGAHGQGGPHSSPTMNMASVNGAPNSAILAAMQAAGGMPSPSLQAGNSPRTNPGQPLSSGMVPAISQIISSIQARNPELSPDEVQRLATHQLNKFQQQQQAQQRNLNQAALNAAAGAANAGAHAANANYAVNGQRPGMMTNEQVQAYNQLMRQQQAAQRANGGPPVQMVGSMNGNRPMSAHGQNPSRSATPQNQRSGSHGLSVNTPTGQSKSPNVQQAQPTS